MADNMFSGLVRKKRALYSTTLDIINDTGRPVLMYYMHPQSHRREFYLEFRTNERNHLTTYIGTTWLAYDQNQQPLFLNKRYNFLVHPKMEKRKVTIIISSAERLTMESRMNSVPLLKPKYLEVLVLGDHALYKRHHSNMTKATLYLQSLMNATNRIFQDANLDVEFHLVVTDIRVMTKDIGVKITRNDPKSALEQACAYMYDLKKMENLKFDFAIFVTRENFGFAGYTPLYRMCVERKSCTLIYESGLHSAFVIAHEIGHALGISHDSEYNNCTNNPQEGSVMSSTVFSKFDKYHWTNCSILQIKENLNYFPCLEDRPRDFHNFSLQLPGVSFPLHDQCVLRYGKGYTPCIGLYRDNNWYCKYTYCKVPGRNKCRYYYAAPADGTECDVDMWCVRGKCIPRGRLQPLPVHGNWSQWSEWSQCVGICGTGLKTKKRVCNNPKPEYGGNYCAGDAADWNVCNLKPCGYQRTFTDQRNAACSLFNGQAWKWFPPVLVQQQASSLNLNCSFEQNNTCSWSRNPNKTHYWRLNRGPTKTRETGPEVDNTFKNATGTYLYMEASSPMRTKEHVSLSSPPLLTPCIQLSFFYHFYGNRMGSLEVLTKRTSTLEDSSENTTTALWKRARKHSNDTLWRRAVVRVEEEREFQLVIKATRGSSYFSDIAVDDITTTSCPAKEEVDCQYTCINNKTRALLVNRAVPDGAWCKEGVNHMCLKGKCKMLGCDGVKGSNATQDKCMVCNGDDSSCALSHGTIIVTPAKSMKRVLIIPVGSTNIHITKITPSNHTKLALRGRGRVYYYEHLPAYFQSHYFKVNNTSFEYRMEDGTESIIAQGPITVPLDIELIRPVYKGNDLVVPAKNKNDTIDLQRSPVSPITKLLNNSRTMIGPNNKSKNLIGSVKNNTPLVSKNQNQTLNGKNKPIAALLNASRPIVMTEDKSENFIGEENNGKRTIRISFKFYVPRASNVSSWTLTHWSQCNKTCNTGYRHPRYACVVNGSRVSSLLCSPSAAVKIEERMQTCNPHQCKVTYVYEVSKWTNCSRCGGLGHRTRLIRCARVYEEKPLISIPVDLSLCKKRPPSTKIRCFKTCIPKTRQDLCIERSKACPGYLKKGFCRYQTVQSLCCKTCANAA